MNGSIIRYILGQVIRLESILMLMPCLVSLIYRESDGYYFLVVAFCGFLLGSLICLKKPQNAVFYLKEGCIVTALSWIVMSCLGCLPFYLSGAIPHIFDAMFETISGFTTTGATILNDVEALSHCMLFWRSLTHWIGGMGVLVFLLAIIPMSGGSNINLMRAESPGPSVGKLVPKIRTTARMLYVIYFGLTLIEMISLIVARMPVFDAVNIALATAGTGGFGVLNSSLADYSVAVQWIVIVFMILFGVNFNAYYLLIFGQIRKAFSIEEVRVYFLIILSATILIAINIFDTTKGIFDAITQSAFQVASLISSTGFSTVDFDTWPAVSKTILVMIMFVGACAGSTGGGIKVSRFLLVLKSVRKELSSYIHPKSIKKIQIDDKPVEHEVIRSVNVYFITFLVVFCLSLFLISFENHDLVTNFTAVATTINNMGPGLSMVGPSQNFSFFTDFSKLVLMFDMLAGRLELFPMLMLFHPTLWKQALHLDKKF